MIPQTFPHVGPFVFALLIPVLVWSLAWKGVALWKAARNGHTAWFVVLFLVNTVGLLEILYILVFSSKPAQEKDIQGSTASE